ncbi:hypothetical protein CEN49_03820, partial [Fischerella thermalis CCMEE 5273]
AKCDLNTYTLFLLAESKYPGCTRLAEIMENCLMIVSTDFCCVNDMNLKIYLMKLGYTSIE